MRTGLFFGTFNPIHRGHEALAASFLSSCRIDELWIVLTPFPPHKETSELAALEDRRAMLNLVFGGQTGVHIAVPEKDLPPPHYTVNTLNHVARKSPDRQFVLCIGGDTLQTIPGWYRFGDIVDLAELLVAERPGASRIVPVELELFTIHFCEHKAVDISSSNIRRVIAGGGNPPESHLHPAVENFIRENRLYRPD